MSGQTNRIPSGFLDLVGAQTGGRNPSEYSNTVAAIVDLSELYAGQTHSAWSEEAVHQNAPRSVFVEVPPGNKWLLRAATVEANAFPTAGFEAWKVSVESLPRQSLVGFSGADDSAPVATMVLSGKEDVASSNMQTVQFAKPFLLVSGAIVRFTMTRRDTDPTVRGTNCHLFFSLLR